MTTGVYAMFFPNIPSIHAGHPTAMGCHMVPLQSLYIWLESGCSS